MRRLNFIGIALIIVLLSGCGDNTLIPINERKINVICTTPMIKDMLDHIGGHRLALQSIIDHNEHPSQAQVSDELEDQIENADIIFFHGLGIDQGLVEQIEELNKKTVNLTQYMTDEDLIFDEKQFYYYVPFVWHDPLLWVKAVKAARDGLINIDPSNRRLYIRQADLYIEKLNVLDVELKKAFSNHDKQIITSDDTLAYFAKRYEFDILWVNHVQTSNTMIEQVMQLMTKNKKVNVMAQFLMPSENINRYYKKTGGKTALETLHTVNIGDFGTPSGTYLGMMLHNKEVIRK